MLVLLFSGSLSGKPSLDDSSCLDARPPELVVPGPLRLHRIGFPLCPLAAASKADNAACNSGEDEDGERHPEPGSGTGGSANVVHLVLDVHEERNINGEDDEGEESSEEGDERCNEEDGEMGGEGKKPGYENRSGGDGVNDGSARPGSTDALAANSRVISIALERSVSKGSDGPSSPSK